MLGGLGFTWRAHSVTQRYPKLSKCVLMLNTQFVKFNMHSHAWFHWEVPPNLRFSEGTSLRFPLDSWFLDCAGCSDSLDLSVLQAKCEEGSEYPFYSLSVQPCT